MKIVIEIEISADYTGTHEQARAMIERASELMAHSDWYRTFVRGVDVSVLPEFPKPRSED